MESVFAPERTAPPVSTNHVLLPEVRLTPLIVAGDPAPSNPLEADSPAARIDPNVATSPFAGVGSLQITVPGTGNFLCSGTAISPRHILTAAHCLDVDGEDGILDVAPANVTFNVNAQGAAAAPIAITASALDIFDTGSDRYAGFTNSINNDLAIITLSADLPAGIPIYEVAQEPLPLQSIITLVGYGTTGNGIDGHFSGTSSPTIKRVGQNQVDNASLFDFLIPAIDEVFIYDFDGPDAATNFLVDLGSGLTLGNQIETTVGPGDSGGPSFVLQGNEWLLVGVNTFGFAFPDLDRPTNEVIQGTFGTGGGGVLLANAEKLNWIDGIIGADSGEEEELGSLTGVVWQDLDGDGDRDLTEPRLPNWEIYLDVNNSGGQDADEPSTLTDATGTYTFADLPPGPYTVAPRLPPGWLVTFPTPGATERFRADFSAGGAASLDGFEIDNTGAPAPGLWHLTTARSAQFGHSPVHSLYFGRHESAPGGGNYDVGHTAGRVITPVINLAGLTSATLTFAYFLNVEFGSEIDQVQVQIAAAQEPFQTVLAKGSTADDLRVVSAATGQWQTATLDLTPYLGRPIQIQFDFNTVDEVFNSFEGWFIDDVVVQGQGSDRHAVVLGRGEAITGLDFGLLEEAFQPDDGGPDLTTPLLEPGFLDYGRFLRYQSATASAPLPTDTIDNLPLASLFDEHFYLQRHPDVAAAVTAGNFTSGYEHFRTQGLREGRNPSILFDETFYRANNVDVAAAIAAGILSSGLGHFLTFGHEEGRDPSQVFNQADYLIQYPDVAATISDGLLQSAFEHYIRFGVTEDRLPDLLLYNEVDYLQANRDVAVSVAAGKLTDGWEHFVRYGQREGRNPSDRFHQSAYLAANPDVQTDLEEGLFTSAFAHYEQFGRFENRPMV